MFYVVQFNMNGFSQGFTISRVYSNSVLGNSLSNSGAFTAWKSIHVV